MPRLSIVAYRKIAFITVASMLKAEKASAYETRPKQIEIAKSIKMRED